MLANGEHPERRKADRLLQVAAIAKFLDSGRRNGGLS
jgi:hypothetical protein